MKLYHHAGNIKAGLFILGVALVIGLLAYTQFLVKSLRQDNREIVRLYASLIANVVKEDSDQNLDFIFENIIKKVKFPLIQTDTENQSKLSVTTSEAHGFDVGAKFYFLNTVSPKTLVLDEVSTETAEDGFDIIDIVDTETANITPDGTKTDTKAVRGAYELRFNADAISDTADTVTWNAHGFRENDVVLYVKPAGTDSQIGGLNSLDFYWVTNPRGWYL